MRPFPTLALVFVRRRGVHTFSLHNRVRFVLVRSGGKAGKHKREGLCQIFLSLTLDPALLSHYLPFEVMEHRTVLDDC